MKYWHTPRHDRREQRAKRHRRHGRDASGGWRAEYRVQRVALPDGGQLQHADADTDRQATRRAEFLDRTTRLPKREAKALAYSELGFSTSGIARRLDAGEGTVTTYRRRAIATFGPAVAEVRLEFVVDRPLAPVTPSDRAGWTDETETVWTDAVDRHPDRAPDWYDGGNQ